MIATRNVKKTVSLLAVLALTLAAFMVVVAADDSDATGMNGNGITDSGFKQDSKGTLTIPISNYDGDIEAMVEVYEKGDLKYSSDTFQIVEDTKEVKVSFKLSKGTHEVNIVFKDLTNNLSSAQSYEIDVEKNIWSNLSTYAAIIVIAIIVVIIAVIYMRQNPNQKPTTTFTQLEEERRAAAEEKEPSAPVKTEKKKYNASESKETGKIKYTSSRRK